MYRLALYNHRIRSMEYKFKVNNNMFAYEDALFLASSKINYTCHHA